ncbi:MAG: hypothetical protein NAG76_11735 [Candidatus Pristimantibacillus lignocellulolyticus]|uniref:Type II secretion system protein GspF domain-containing protein n=1 Tax=Candidatus Pristimantibacillus lignocellulolyticus TaxID=2994561 RepID=A0A9J6Z980_9BACL|nr:MAG: hypothetical protein NAG76_11735 [Candidatus Pristimantibacillus lignocellulolyticus]
MIFQVMTLFIVGVLFLVLMYIIENLIITVFTRQRRKSRLTTIVTTQTLRRKSWIQRFVLKVITHLNHLLQTLRFSASGERLFHWLLSIALVGGVLGYYMFGSMKGAILCSAMVAGIPYICLKMLLIHRQLEAQIDFLPAVELFYQCYLITGERQIKIALAKVIEENRIAGPMKGIFEQLYRNLCVRDNDDESLDIFANSLGHIWADYFVQMVKVALHEGVTISSSLKQLIHDMRAARRANEQERHQLLEIRIANFTPLIFLLLFVVINFKYNREQSLHYYFYDQSGREMILHMITMIFLSFLMGIYLSRKKMT